MLSFCSMVSANSGVAGDCAKSEKKIKKWVREKIANENRK